MDISSEMIHSLLPMFMVGTLGMGMTTVGLIEGLAEATALIMLLSSTLAGLLWDRLGPATTFMAGAGFCGLPLLALMWQQSRR